MTRCLLALSFFALTASAIAADKDADVEKILSLDKTEMARLKALPEHEKKYAEARLTGLYVVLPLSSDPDIGDIGTGFDRVSVDQVLDGENFIGSGNEWWIEGVGTSKLTDDSVVGLEDFVLLAAGTKSYTTVLGAKRTVKHFVTIDTTAADQLLSVILDKRGYRLWRDTKDVTLIAKFTRKSGRIVTLALPTGKQVRMRLEQFGETDQEWIMTGRKAASEVAEK